MTHQGRYPNQTQKYYIRIHCEACEVHTRLDRSIHKLIAKQFFRTRKMGIIDLYTVISIDDTKNIKQLSFVLMDSLDLYIKHCIWADLQEK